MYHFAGGFEDNYVDAYARSLNRWRPIYEMAVQSFKETIRPNAENAALLRSARNEVASVAAQGVQVHATGVNSTAYIATHIRRGDKHASSWAYHNGYIPIKDYVEAVNATWPRVHNGSTTSLPIVYLASDSPDAQKEFISQLPDGAKVFSLANSENPDLRALASPQPYNQKEFDNFTHAERVASTRGMIVDLGMLSGLWAWPNEVQPSATICTISSTICKLVPIGLTWERAFGFKTKADSPTGDLNEQTKQWVEIDTKGNVEPVWKPFDISFH